MDLNINEAFRNLIPPLSDHELQCLEAEIRYWAGCYSPIITWNGTIIDGHHRYTICKKHGLPFKIEERQFDDEHAVMIWMIDNQMGRRNITDAAKIRLALKKEDVLARQAEGRSLSNLKQNNTDVENLPPREIQGKVRDLIGQDAGVSGKTVDKFKYIEKHAPEIADNLCTGKIVDGRRLSIDGAYREVQRQERKEKLKTTEFPQGKYRVIYADPPWDYKTGDNSKNTSDPEIHYELMSIEDICNMPVKDIVDENAVLFLWTTSYHIFESKKVLDAWNFNYKSMFIWDKVKHNMGCYNSVRHEILLIATKGSCVPDNVELIDSVQTIERTRHSEKPERFREIIDTLYKHGNKVELFARKKVEGWEGFGNECM